jgi:hypothetical protein
MPNGKQNPRDELIPNPDPSTITSGAIDRAVFNSETRITARIDGMEKAVEVFHADLTRVPTSVDKAILSLRELLETRLKCMESDVSAVHGNLETRGDDIKDQVQHLRELVFSEFSGRDKTGDEIFKRIETQFVERDKRTEQLALASSTAIAAALQAQKEAAGATTDSILAVITKMDASFTKLFDQMANLLTAQQKNTDDKINDLKSRMDKGEGVGSIRDPHNEASIAWMKEALATNAAQVLTNAAHGKGAEDNWKNLTIIGGLIIAGIALFIHSGGGGILH